MHGRTGGTKAIYYDPFSSCPVPTVKPLLLSRQGLQRSFSHGLARKAKESQFNNRKAIGYGSVLNNASELFSVKKASEETAATGVSGYRVGFLFYTSILIYNSTPSKDTHIP